MSTGIGNKRLKSEIKFYRMTFLITLNILCVLNTFLLHPALTYKLEIDRNVKNQFDTDLSFSEESEFLESRLGVERGSGFTTTSLVFLVLIGVTSTLVMLSLAAYVIYTFLVDCIGCYKVARSEHP